MRPKKLLNYTTHNSERKSAVYTGMSLPICHLCMEAIALDSTVEKVLCCWSKRTKDRKAKGNGIETMVTAHSLVLISLPLLHRGQYRCSILPPVTGYRHTKQVHAAAVIAAPCILEDIDRLREPRPTI